MLRIRALNHTSVLKAPPTRMPIRAPPAISVLLKALVQLHATWELIRIKQAKANASHARQDIIVGALGWTP